MNLILNNHLINTEISDILKKLKEENTAGYLKDIGRENNNNIKITCPFHKEGKEMHPSCYVYTGRDNEYLEYGYYKCFTCGSKGPLYKLISKCLGIGDEESKKWLIDNFSNTLVETELFLPRIELNGNQETYLDDKILNQYAFYHPYLEDRGISFETAKKFQVGWNKEHNSITFPVWDRHGRLTGITERYIDEKKFNIPSDMKKPIYLLDFIIEEGHTSVFVCESQINCLTLWEWGYPAIALFGTGSRAQYEILKTSGIRHYYLCFDGDEAGRKGASRFIKYMNKDIIITNINLPEGKDVNDLRKEEFEKLLNNS